MARASSSCSFIISDYLMHSGPIFGRTCFRSTDYTHNIFFPILAISIILINAADLFIAQQIVLGVITPTTQDIIHADLYPVGAPDGVINISDLILFEKLILSPAF